MHSFLSFLNIDNAISLLMPVAFTLSYICAELYFDYSKINEIRNWKEFKKKIAKVVPCVRLEYEYEY